MRTSERVNLYCPCSIYKCPNNPGHDSGHDCFKFKVVGAKVHGVLVALYIVPSFIPDDANLNATILTQTLKEVKDVRTAAGKGEQFPRRLYAKVDGVSG